MQTKVILTIMFVGLLINSYGQQNTTWDKWEWLTGDWIGVGAGQPGKGGGSFSFHAELDNRILVRKSHSEFPAAANKPAVVHDDLMVIYPDSGVNASKAIYFDNEGHTINYAITYADKSIVLTSNKAPGVPVFRLTYSLLENNVVNTTFEMSQDGEHFMTYIEGKSSRIE